MTGLMGLLNLANDGLAAQTFGLNVTGQNVTNANTPQYMRRVALLESQAGPGVSVQGLSQVSDPYADRDVLNATSLQSSASELDGDLATTETLFNDSNGTGLSSSLNQLFSVFQQLSANPSDPTVRQSVLDAAGQLASRANNIAGTVAQQRSDLYTKAEQAAKEANEKSEAIAKLNQQIVEAQMAGQDASGLIDQRNQVMLGLSQIINVHVLTGSNGAVTVQAGGSTLVDGTMTRDLSVGLDGSGNIAYFAQRTGSNDAPLEITPSVTGGSLAGIKQARDVDLSQVATQFDSFVFDVATAVNTQHAAGVGLDGQSGRNLFDLPSTSADAGQLISLSTDVAGHPEYVAAATDASDLSGDASNAVLLSQLSTSPVVGGTRSPSDAYGDLVGNVGMLRSSSKADLSMRQGILQQATAARESISGVSMDEETTNLQKYQEAYQANSKLLTTVSGLLQDLMNAVV